jgi:hypothetical protein
MLELERFAIQLIDIYLIELYVNNDFEDGSWRASSQSFASDSGNLR